MSKGDKECKIFVGGLHLDTEREDLKDYFGKWGEIVDAIVMTDPVAKKSRGFGFVTYADPESVEECLRTRPHIVNDKEVEAKRAVPKEDITPNARTRTKKVFLGGLARETTKQDISDKLKEILGVEPVDVVIMTERETEKPRGFGFATFDDYDLADKICLKKYIKILERDVEVKKAVSQDDMRKDGGGGGRYQSRAPPPSNSHYDYPAGRESMYPRQMYSMGGRMAGGYDYGNPYAAADYMRTAREYPGMSAYPMPASYDRGAGNAGYSTYGSSRGSPYEMSPSGYSSMYGAGMMGAYQQTASAYGPARGYADYSGREREKTDTRSSYHPYRR